jgi:hypothetical protein
MGSFLKLREEVYKTDESKRGHFSFGGEVLTDKKSPPLFFRSIFIPTHHFLCFVFSFSLFQWIGSENAV